MQFAATWAATGGRYRVFGDRLRMVKRESERVFGARRNVGSINQQQTYINIQNESDLFHSLHDERGTDNIDLSRGRDDPGLLGISTRICNMTLICFLSAVIRKNSYGKGCNRIFFILITKSTGFYLENQILKGDSTRV